MGELTWSEQERRRLVRLCAVLTGDPAAADDLAQETLLEAWRIRDRLVDPGGRRPWLDAIARNVCHRWRVRTARRSAHELGSDRPDDEPGAPPAHRDELGEWLEREELVELLDRALALLLAWQPVSRRLGVLVDPVGFAQGHVRHAMELTRATEEAEEHAEALADAIAKAEEQGRRTPGAEHVH